MSVFRRDTERREGAGPMIPCACLCGATLQQFDAWGRERKFKPGHHLRVLWANTDARDAAPGHTAPPRPK